MRPYIFWPWCSGLVFLAAGLTFARRRIATARGIDKIVPLGPILVAASLATFGAEHFTLTSFIQNDIPAWMPARLFVAYFVGVALYAAATSFTIGRLVRLSAGLLALMFLIFVLAMHVPNALHATDRFPWIVALRDFTFGAGALALAATRTRHTAGGSVPWMARTARLVLAAALVVFGVEHILHPLNALVVPLEKLTPRWIPLPAAWGYATGALEIVVGGCSFANIRTRAAATWMGLAAVLLVIVVYLPLAAVAVDGSQKIEAENYIWDTALFAGAVLLVAGAMPTEEGRVSQ